MKKILFFTTSSYPNPNANGICVNQILLELINKKFEVHLICFRKSEEPEYSLVNGIHIYRVKDTLSSYLKEKSGKINNIKISEFSRDLSHIIHRLKVLVYFPWFPVTSVHSIYRFYKLGDALHKKHNFDIVFSSYNPIEGLISSNLIKKKYSDVKLGMYVLDSLTNTGGGRTIGKEKIDKKGWKWEKKFYEDADLILNMKSHEEHHSQSRYNPYRDKMSFVDIPLLNDSSFSMNKTHKNDKHISIVYSGSLNSFSRNPEYACEIFSRIGNEKYRVDFYSKGDCEQKLSEYQENTNGMISRNGYIPHEEMLDRSNKASFLLSIGNKNSDMIPSKIFEYMSTGKPIIHFYDNEKDSSLPYLKKYSLALLVKQEYEIFDSNAMKVENFISDNFGRKVLFSNIEKTFKRNKPEYTVNKIIDM